MKKARLMQVSSLVDDEHDGDLRSPIDGLLKDPELRAVWQRYHELSDWMKGSADGNPVQVDIASRVRSAIETEPTLLFPANRRPAVTEQPRPKRWSQFAGMGIAAAVASVTVLLFQQPGGLGVQREVVAVMTNQADSLAAPISVATLNSGVPEESGASVADEQLAGEEFQRKLDAYLASHVKQSAGHHAQGLLPYPTFVDHEVAPKVK